VVRPYFSPDGERIAFTRGTQGQAETLWAIRSDGTEAQELVAQGRLQPYREGAPLIAEVAWLDNDTLLFNTAQAYSWGMERQDDLYRVDLDTDELTRLFPRGEGGAFSISPDRRFVAIVYPGASGSVQGRIRLYDPVGLSIKQVLSFEGATAAGLEPYYPTVDWSPDSASVYTAIPAWTLPEYQPVTANLSVTLWRLQIDDEAQRAGVVQAHPAGLPRWTANLAHTVYLRAPDSLMATDTLELVYADTNGANGQVVAQVEGGGADFAFYPVANAPSFVYRSLGAFWWIVPDGAPQPLAEAESIAITDTSLYVYVTSSDGQTELRYHGLGAGIRLSHSVIATVSEPHPAFDAVWADSGAP
jgi:hypothetical protein